MVVAKNKDCCGWNAAKFEHTKYVTHTHTYIYTIVEFILIFYVFYK